MSVLKVALARSNPESVLDFGALGGAPLMSVKSGWANVSEMVLGSVALCAFGSEVLAAGLPTKNLVESCGTEPRRMLALGVRWLFAWGIAPPIPEVNSGAQSFLGPFLNLQFRSVRRGSSCWSALLGVFVDAGSFAVVALQVFELPENLVTACTRRD